jgi:hypothetical protein
MAAGEARLQVVVDHKGQRAHFGPLQSGWLLEQHLVERTGYEGTGPASGIDYYRPIDGLTVFDVHERVLEQPHLRECDFCRATPAGWRIAMRAPFDLTQGPTPGRFTRPAFACTECSELVRNHDKVGLIERAIVETVEYARNQGGALEAHVQGLTSQQIKVGLTPLVREVVTKVFANKRDEPERDDGAP